MKPKKIKRLKEKRTAFRAIRDKATAEIAKLQSYKLDIQDKIDALSAEITQLEAEA
jgi:uncharacterized coiled-coil DUF342 family protein